MFDDALIKQHRLPAVNVKKNEKDYEITPGCITDNIKTGISELIFKGGTIHQRSVCFLKAKK